MFHTHYQIYYSSPQYLENFRSLIPPLIIVGNSPSHHRKQTLLANSQATSPFPFHHQENLVRLIWYVLHLCHLPHHLENPRHSGYESIKSRLHLIVHLVTLLFTYFQQIRCWISGAVNIDCLVDGSCVTSLTYIQKTTKAAAVCSKQGLSSSIPYYTCTCSCELLVTSRILSFLCLYGLTSHP